MWGDRLAQGQEPDRGFVLLARLAVKRRQLSALASGSSVQTPVDDRLDFFQRQFDQARKLLQRVLPSILSTDLFVGQQLVKKPVREFLLDLFKLLSLLTCRFRSEPFFLLLVPLLFLLFSFILLSDALGLGVFAFGLLTL